MLEVPIVREIYWSGVTITSLFIILSNFKLYFNIKYNRNITKFIIDILSPIFMSFVMIFLVAGFSWIGLLAFNKLEKGRK